MKKYTQIVAFGLFLFALLAVVVLSNKPALLTVNIHADGAGTPPECETTVNVDNGSGSDTVSYTDPNGAPITGVCIKAGSANSQNPNFGNGHSGVLTENGDYEDGCYTISGLGTATVTVTHNIDANTCHDISHLDLALGQAEPTATPSSEPTATPSADPTATPSATPAPTDNSNGTGGGDNGGGNSNSNSSSNSNNNSSGQILSASTYAPTGILDTLVTALTGATGVVAAMSGSILYVKKRFIG